jgi:thiol-disulfide isomerase/thioredoxin
MRAPLVTLAAFASLATAAFACSSDPAAPDKAAQVRVGGGGTDAAGGSGGATTTMGTGGAGGGSDAGAGGGTAAAGSTGTGGSTAGNYPSGPYGQTVGTVIPDDCFEGLLDPPGAGYVSAGNTSKICFHDFYNPGGADPSKPKVLVIMIGALWCGPCQTEAAAGKKNHDYWAPFGVQFMATVYQNKNQDPATYPDLDYWTKTYKLNYPSVLDPASKLGKYFTVGAFPTNIVLDTTTMTFLYADAGEVNFGPANTILKSATGM